MTAYRTSPPKSILGSPVVKVVDMLVTAVDGEHSNVLQFTTADGTKVSVRPSGTEPKIKYYFGVRAPLPSVDDFARVEAELDAKIEAIKRELQLV
jgi:phosphoglucomutase